jgi:predicted nucleotidyltransferase
VAAGFLGRQRAKLVQVAFCLRVTKVATVALDVLNALRSPDFQFGQNIEKMFTIDALRVHREQILAVAAKFGAKNVRVFGSVARGEAHSESDVDLLVDFEPGRSLFDHAGLVIELEALLARKVEIGTTNGLRERYRHRIVNEAIDL